MKWQTIKEVDWEQLWDDWSIVVIQTKTGYVCGTIGPPSLGRYIEVKNCHYKERLWIDKEDILKVGVDLCG